MKILSTFVFCYIAVSAFAQQTAYQALNVVGKVRGEAFLDNLLVLQGKDGHSQPGYWTLIFRDNASRGGYREIEVRGGEIASQRAPLRGPDEAAHPVNLNRLQLDSDGAFTVAEREAALKRISFSTAIYSLESADDSGAPVWRVQLLNQSGDQVQSLQIAADSGNIVGRREASSAQSRDYVVQDERTESIERTETVADQPESDSDSPELKIHRTAVRTSRNIKNAFKHVGGSLQEVFTGRRTIDRNSTEE